MKKECGSAILGVQTISYCKEDFPLERKLEKFVTLSLRGYKVPEDEVQQVLRFLAGQDLRGVAQSVMEELFRQLAMRYEFSLDGLLPPEKQKPVEEREDTA